MPTIRYTVISAVGYGLVDSAQIRRINSFVDVTVKRGIGAIGCALDVFMLHDVPMDVIHMPFKIVPIMNIILTETPLPDGALAVLGIRLADPL